MEQEDVFRWIDIYGVAGKIILIIAAIAAAHHFFKALALIVSPPQEYIQKDEFPTKQVVMRVIAFIFLTNMVLFIFATQNTFNFETTGIESTLAINDRLLQMVNDTNSNRYSQAHWMDSLTIITVIGFIMTIGIYGVYEGSSMLGRLGDPGAESMGFTPRAAMGRMLGGFLCWNAMSIAQWFSIIEY